MCSKTLTATQKLEANERKQDIIRKRGYKCEVCGSPVNYYTAQLAHRIPKGYIKLYGAEIINHPLNMIVTCCLKCNSSVLLSPAVHPVESDKLIETIKKLLADEHWGDQ